MAKKIADPGEVRGGPVQAIRNHLRLTGRRVPPWIERLAGDSETIDVEAARRADMAFMAEMEADFRRVSHEGEKDKAAPDALVALRDDFIRGNPTLEQIGDFYRDVFAPGFNRLGRSTRLCEECGRLFPLERKKKHNFCSDQCRTRAAMRGRTGRALDLSDRADRLAEVASKDKGKPLPRSAASQILNWVEAIRPHRRKS